MTKTLLITMDYRLDRINLEIDNGIVTATQALANLANPSQSLLG